VSHAGGVDHYEEDASNQLTVRFRADSDGIGQIMVRVAAEGFSGQSAAWLDQQRLIEFATSLADVPILEDASPLVVLGFFKRGTPELEQELVSLSVRPVGLKGQIGVTIHLASEMWPEMQQESLKEVRLELLTTYERLRQFSDHLIRVVNGELEQATLRGEELL